MLRPNQCGGWWRWYADYMIPWCQWRPPSVPSRSSWRRWWRPPSPWWRECLGTRKGRGTLPLACCLALQLCSSQTSRKKRILKTWDEQYLMNPVIWNRSRDTSFCILKLNGTFVIFAIVKIIFRIKYLEDYGKTSIPKNVTSHHFTTRNDQE